MAGYMALNAVVLVVCGLATIWLLGRFPRANPWLLAMSPTLALYVVLNWDLLSIVALVLALWLFRRRRDGWSAVALGVATWTKFFPVIALPVLLSARLLESRDTPLSERARALVRILLPFAAVTVVFNVPFLLAQGAAASNWSYFFRFNAWRGVGGSLWSLVSDGHMGGPTANADSAILTVAGLAVIFAVDERPGRRLSGGFCNVTTTLKSFASCVVEVCCEVATPVERTIALSPISVTTPVKLLRGMASMVTSAGCPSFTFTMSVSSTFTSEVMTDMSAIVISVLPGEF